MPLNTVSHNQYVLDILKKIGVDYELLDARTVKPAITLSNYYYVIGSKDNGKLLQLFAAFPDSKHILSDMVSSVHIKINNVHMFVITDYEVYMRTMSVMSNIIEYMTREAPDADGMFIHIRNIFNMVMHGMDDMYAYVLHLRDYGNPIEEVEDEF